MELMKSVRVSIQDEHTLVLQEDAAKGDTIDLTSLHETDIDQTTIKSVVNSIKKDAFEAEINRVRKQIEHEKRLEAQLKEQELLDKVRLLEHEKKSAVEMASVAAKTTLQADIAKRDADIAELRAQLQATATERQLAVTQAVSAVEKQRDQLASDL